MDSCGVSKEALVVWGGLLGFKEGIRNWGAGRARRGVCVCGRGGESVAGDAVKVR